MGFYLARAEENGFLDRLVAQSTIAAEVGKAVATVAPVEFVSPWHLSGDFAWALWTGGAYERFRGSPEEADAIARDAARQLVDGRYNNEVPIHRIQKAWADWHTDVAWDSTWFGSDPQRRQVWILSYTDTD